jgi:hypothetical protein
VEDIIVPCAAVESNRFERIFVKVDLPDDFGPHTRMHGAFCTGGTESLDSASFHSGAEIIGCKYAPFGPSSEENNFPTGQLV